MLDVLEKEIDKSNADFIELRLVSTQSTQVNIRNKEVETANSGFVNVFGVRAMVNGSWGFASANELSKLTECVSNAESLAKAASKKSIGADLADAPVTVKNVDFKVTEDPQDVDLEDKVSRCMDLSKRGLGKSKVVSTDLRYMDSFSNKYYVNSEGSRISFNPTKTFFAFGVFVKDGKLMSFSDAEGGGHGFELLSGKEKMVDDVCEDASLLLKSHLAPKGSQTVIVDPKMAGTLAHEAVGHALEADTIINNNSVITKINQLIGSSKVSISDDPTLFQKFGSYPFDAEGVPGKKTVLLKEGRVKNFLHSRETAFKKKHEVTGNARSQGPTEFPIVRMSNTFFEKGDCTMEELLEGVNGIYVRGFKGGVVDTDTGFFQFASPHGSLIENGELTKPLRDITLLGNIVKTLKHVNSVGKDIRVGFPGMCGKSGQAVPVSSGGPHLKIDEVLVG